MQKKKEKKKSHLKRPSRPILNISLIQGLQNLKMVTLIRVSENGLYLAGDKIKNKSNEPAKDQQLIISNASNGSGNMLKGYCWKGVMCHMWKSLVTFRPHEQGRSTALKAAKLYVAKIGHPDFYSTQLSLRTSYGCFFVLQSI